MPQNSKTGKSDRRARPNAEPLDLRIEKAGESVTEVQKGKQRAQDSPGADEPEGSRPAPSPVASLNALEHLTLGSTGSSAGNTPADSSAAAAALPQLLLPDRPAAAPSSPPKAKDASKNSAGKSAFEPLAAAPTQRSTAIVKAPAASNRPKRAHRQAGRPHRQPSPASSDGGNAARIAVLESRQDEVEKRLNDLDFRLRKLGG